MADWFIATEGVKVVKDSAGLWSQIITAVSSAGAALGGVCLTHRFARRREERAAADKAAAERLYITTELVFLLERYASAWEPLLRKDISTLCAESDQIPALDLSAADGNWRVLPARQIFRIRSLEADQTALYSRVEQEKSLPFQTVRQSLILECYRTALRAFILAAKLRREAGLPDSAHLRDRLGPFRMLRAGRKRCRYRAIQDRRTAIAVYEAWMSHNSPPEENEKSNGRSR